MAAKPQRLTLRDLKSANDPSRKNSALFLVRAGAADGGVHPELSGSHHHLPPVSAYQKGNGIFRHATRAPRHDVVRNLLHIPGNSIWTNGGSRFSNEDHRGRSY